MAAMTSFLKSEIITRFFYFFKSGPILTKLEIIYDTWVIWLHFIFRRVCRFGLIRTN